MKLLSLRMDGFGKFRDVNITLKKGFNVLYGLNESGKSTVHAFIEGMFYGFLDPTKKRRVYFDEHDRYRPRDSAPYQGALVFEQDGKRYRIERNFDKDKADVRLYNDTTGKDISDTLPYDSRRKQIDIAAFIDMPYNLYKNSLSIAELGSRTDADAADDLFRRLQSLNATKTETLSVSKAKEYLEDLEKEIGSSRGQKQPYPIALKRKQELESEREETIKHHEEILKAQAELDEKKESLATLEAEKDALTKTLAKQENTKKLNVLSAIEEEKDRVQTLLEQDAEENIEIDVPFLEKARKEKEYAGKWESVASDYDAFRENAVNLQSIRENYPDESDRLDDDKYETIRQDHERYKEANKTRQTQTASLETERDRLAKVLEADKDAFKRNHNLMLASMVLLAALPASIVFAVFGFFVVFVICLALTLLGFAGTIAFFLLRKTSSGKIAQSQSALHEQEKAIEEEQSKIENAEREIDALMKHYEADDEEALQAMFYSSEQKVKNHQKALQYDERMQEHESRMDEILKKHRPLLRRFKLKGEAGLKTLKAIREPIREIERLLQGRTYEEFTADIDKGEKVSLEDYEDNLEALKELEQSLQTQQRKIVENETALAHKKAQSRPLSTIDYELEKTAERIEEMEEKKAAINDAKKLLYEASEAIEETFSPVLRENIESFLPDLTGKQYEDIRVRKDLTFRAEHPLTKRFETSSFFSKGTLDQMYLAIRLGVLKTLGKEEYPLFLDDAFVNFDDERLKSALALFDKLKKNHQIVLFTCHKREEDTLRDFDLSFHHQVLC